MTDLLDQITALMGKARELKHQASGMHQAAYMSDSMVPWGKIDSAMAEATSLINQASRLASAYLDAALGSLNAKHGTSMEFGYIGNVTRHGDNRSWRFWLDTPAGSFTFGGHDADELPALAASVAAGHLDQWMTKTLAIPDRTEIKPGVFEMHPPINA